MKDKSELLSMVEKLLADSWSTGIRGADYQQGYRDALLRVKVRLDAAREDKAAKPSQN